MIPRIVIRVPVEGPATARLHCLTAEDELRAALDLDQRDVLMDVGEALVRLCDALALGEEEAS